MGRQGEEGRREGGPRAALAALDELTIAQQGDQAVITDKRATPASSRPTAARSGTTRPLAAPPSCGRAWDKNDILTVEVRPDKGPKRKETYIVSNDGEHLYLTLTLEGDGRRPK